METTNKKLESLIYKFCAVAFGLTYLFAYSVSGWGGVIAYTVFFGILAFVFILPGYLAHKIQEWF
jgi:amino acid permease